MPTSRSFSVNVFKRLALSERNESKGFAGVPALIGVLILIVLGGAIYSGKLAIKLPLLQTQTSISPTPQVQKADEVINWKTYTDPDLNFSIKYPQSWYLDTQGTSEIGTEVAISSFNIKTMQQKRDYRSGLRVNIFIKKTTETSLNAYVKSLNQGKILSSEKIIVAGEDGIRQKVEGEGVYFVIHVIQNGYAYLISASPLDSNYIATFDQILSTFKFNP